MEDTFWKEENDPLMLIWELEYCRTVIEEKLPKRSFTKRVEKRFDRVPFSPGGRPELV